MVNSCKSFFSRILLYKINNNMKTYDSRNIDMTASVREKVADSRFTNELFTYDSCFTCFKKNKHFYGFFPALFKNASWLTQRLWNASSRYHQQHTFTDLFWLKLKMPTLVSLVFPTFFNQYDNIEEKIEGKYVIIWQNGRWKGQLSRMAVLDATRTHQGSKPQLKHSLASLSPLSTQLTTQQKYSYRQPMV